MDEEMPKIILGIVVTMIIFGVGVFAFYITANEIGYQSGQTEEFAVTDPSVAQTCTLEQYPKSVTLIEQYNGITWVTVDPTHYSVDVKVVTVQPGGMQG